MGYLSLLQLLILIVLEEGKFIRADEEYLSRNECVVRNAMLCSSCCLLRGLLFVCRFVGLLVWHHLCGV